jgi:hypothetical protein
MAITCTTLIYTPINAISFRIVGGTKIITPHMNSKNVITSLETGKGIFLTLGDTIKVKGVKYKAGTITKYTLREVVHYDVSMCVRTKASTFILPLLGGNRKLFLWGTYFVNAHLNKDKTLTLVYRTANDPLLNRFRSTIESFSIFLNKTEIGKTFIAYTLKIRPKHLKIVNFFIKGKYSKFSLDYKLKVLDFHNKEMDNIIGEVLFKSKKRRRYLEAQLDCEIAEDIDLLSLPEDEEFNLNKYIK